jgi:hypothetical protein
MAALSQSPGDDMEILTAFWRLHVEGVLMFQIDGTANRGFDNTTIATE